MQLQESVISATEQAAGVISVIIMCALALSRESMSARKAYALGARVGAFPGAISTSAFRADVSAEGPVSCHVPVKHNAATSRPLVSPTPD